MRDLACLGLTVGLGIAAAALSVPASASVYVGVGAPEIVVAPPAVVVAPYWYGAHWLPPRYARYGWHPYGYPYGLRPGLNGYHGFRRHYWR